MNLKGKICLFLGDSITFGNGTSWEGHRYWEILARETGAVCKNYGEGGTMIARQQNPDLSWGEHFLHHFATRVEKMETPADVIGVLGGVNDFGAGDAPMGCMADRTQDTFYGACHDLFTRLIERYPQALIVVMTPLHFSDEDVGTARYNGTVREHSLQEYVNALREVAEYYSLPVLDLFRSAGIQPKIPAQRELFMPDGLHPNDAGHERMAERLIGFLKAL